MKRTFVSFDIFDTCLIRRCGEPHKIWDLMAEELFDKDDVRGRLSFVGNRRVAESKLSSDDLYPTFDDIYEELDVTQWGLTKNEVMQLELDIEERELFPNTQMLDVVKKMRKQGFTISFISDMYLPSSFLKKMLMKYGFLKEDDNIFVSAECKAAKCYGGLFDYVFKKTGTRGSQWIHYGDNENADYSKPRAKGVEAHLVRDCAFTTTEKQWLDDARFYTHKHEIELWVGLCRYCRLNVERDEAHERAIDLVASLYVPYVHWVLETARKNCVKKLFFLARDAHIFLEIAKQFSNQFPEIELKYLKLSRRSLYACAFYDVDDYEMKLTIGQCIAQTARTAVEYIGMQWEDLSKKTRKLYREETILTSSRKAMAFARTLAENDKDVILRKSKEYRRVFLEYLKQENVLNSCSRATVDLGWIGSGRCLLNHILRKENENTLISFYWGCNSGLINGLHDDNIYVFQRQYDVSEKSQGAVLFLEQYASVNGNGTTVGYKCNEGCIEPVEKEANLVDVKLVSTNEISVSLAAREANHLLKSEYALFDIFLCCGLKQLQKIQDNPSNDDLRFFSSIETESFGRKVKLVQPLLFKNKVSLAIWGIAAIPQWQTASIKLSFGRFAGMYTSFYKWSSNTLFAAKLQQWWDRRK